MSDTTGERAELTHRTFTRPSPPVGHAQDRAPDEQATGGGPARSCRRRCGARRPSYRSPGDHASTQNGLRPVSAPGPDPDRTSIRYLEGVRVDVTLRTGVTAPTHVSTLVRAIVGALRAAHAPMPASVSLILTDDAEMATLNEEHMGHEGPTDVLSFPMLPPAAYPAHAGQDPAVRTSDGLDFATPPGVRTHVGDIVVSVERAIEQAEQGRGGQTGDQRWSPADELRLLVTHGTLHLCGWDHVLPAEEAAMRTLERALLEGDRAALRSRA